MTGFSMPWRLLAALLVLLLGAASANAQSEPVLGTAGSQSAGQPSLKLRDAGTALQRGSVDAAITLYTEALEDKTLSNDRRATILNDRGVAYSRRQNYKEAIDDFNRAIQLYPEYPAVYNNRGNVLLGLGAVREAIKDFDRALLLAPGYAAAYSNRAGAYMKLGQIEQAIAGYTKAIQLTPTSPAALSGRGRAQLAANRPHGAIRDFTRAVSLDARFGAGYRSRAEAKLSIERYDEAIEDFSRAIAFEPRNADIYALRGQAYLESGNAPSALKDFSTAVELSPNSATALAARGLAFARAEAFDEALNDFARAIELDPRSPKVYAYRAWTYRQQQQPELALKDIERAFKLDANSAEAHWARGEIYEALGRSEVAIADLKRALVLNPQMKDAMRALERMGVSPAAEEPEVANAGYDRWRVRRQGRDFVATSDEFPRLRVTLEMVGKGQPRILDWEVKQPPFAGIGALRFDVGSMDGPKGPEQVENVAILDLQSNTVVAVVVQKQGDSEARWQWEEGKLIVTGADGITDELELRQKPKEPPKRYANDQWNKGWGSESRRKPKTLFDLLFKF
jgi:tetratricopeptide (TPR) repeat protein